MPPQVAGPLAEDQKVRERIAAEPVGTVEPSGALAGRKEPRQRELWVSPSTRIPPMM